MAGPYDDIYGLRPDLQTLDEPDPLAFGDMLRFAGQDRAQIVPPEMAGLPIEPEPIPDDFWARMAQAGGPQPFNFRPRPKPTGLELLLALAAGFGNAKAARGAQRVARAEKREKQVNENARALALHRHQMAREKLEQQGATERTRLTTGQQSAKLLQDAADAALRRGDQQEWRRIMEDIYRDRIAMQGRLGGVGDGSGGVVGDSGAGPPPKPRAATASEVEHLTIDSSMLSQIGRTKQQYSPSLVGPIAGRKSGLRVSGVLGKKNPPVPGEAKFRGSLAGIRNMILKARSGGAVTEGEASRLLQELPGENLPSESFTERMDQFEQTYREIAERRRSNLAALGTNLSRVAPLPGASVWAGQSAATSRGMSDDDAYKEYLRVSEGK